jgi:hypothetical protein
MSQENVEVVLRSGRRSEFGRPFVPVIRRGGLLLFPVADLERWVDETAERADVAA